MQGNVTEGSPGLSHGTGEPANRLERCKMLRTANEIIGYRIDAEDGEMGKVNDFYFDDESWTVRYLVVDTGTWLPGRKVLISPAAVGEPDADAGAIPVSLTAEQVEASPSIDADRPVSRQDEKRLAGYYSWPVYWAPLGTPSMAVVPGQVPVEEQQVGGKPESEDPDLRSTDEVAGYRIHAADGEIGHVEDFLVDPDGWDIRYLAVDTRNWLPGRKVLVSPRWIDRISWATGEVWVQLTRQAVKDSPEYDPTQPVNREYEAALFSWYGMPTYW